MLLIFKVLSRTFYKNSIKLKIEVFDISPNSNERFGLFKATDRTISISKVAKIDDLSQAVASRIILSEFPHNNGYPLAFLTVKVMF